MRYGCTIIAALVGALVITASADADATPIGPFNGTLHENFNQHDNVVATESLSVFGGFGTLNNLSQDGAIKVEFSSSLNGDLVTPISDMMAGQLGIGLWEFDQPLQRFGGWWENNSGADDATVEFFNVQGNLIDTAVADVPFRAQQWTWNGWSFDEPVSSIRVTGNGLINGFIWYEDLELDPYPVPAPSVVALLALGGFAARRRRR